MPPFVNKTLAQGKEFWGGLSKSQKSRILIISGATVASVVLLLAIVTRPSRMTLFSGNDKAQIGEMATILSENGIWNRLENAGTSITIDTKDNDQAQVTLAQAGYPKDGLAFEDAISMIGLTTTDAEKKKIWKQQTVADIEKKIKMLDMISNATVQLAIPEKSIFLTNEQQPVRPTSTVTIWPIDNMRILPAQIDGIKQVVVGSVEDLAADDINVIDNFGNLLEGSTDQDPLELTQNQDALREKWASMLETNVYKLYGYGIGKNGAFDNFSVVVSPYLDFSQQSYTSETLGTPSGFDENTGALLEQRTRTESAQNYAVGGVPAMDTNPGETTPIYPLDGGNGTGTYSMSDNQLAFGYDKRVETGSKVLGEFVPEKSSLSIVLGYGLDVADDSGLTDEFMADIRNAASTATGIPVVNVSAIKMPLARPSAEALPVSERVSQLVSEYGLPLLLLLLVAALVLSLFVRRKKPGEAAEETVEDLQMQIAEGIIEPDDIPQTIQAIDVEQKSEIREQLERLIQQKPEAVASLLRNWLAEDV